LGTFSSPQMQNIRASVEQHSVCVHTQLRSFPCHVTQRALFQRNFTAPVIGHIQKNSRYMGILFQISVLIYVGTYSCTYLAPKNDMHLAYEVNQNMFVATDKSQQMTEDYHITLQSVQLASTLLLTMYYTPVSCPVVLEHSFSKMCKYSRYIIKGSSGHTQNTILIKFNCKLSKLAGISKGVQHSYTLLPTLLDIHLDKIITK